MMYNEHVLRTLKNKGYTLSHCIFLDLCFTIYAFCLGEQETENPIPHVKPSNEPPISNSEMSCMVLFCHYNTIWYSQKERNFQTWRIRVQVLVKTGNRFQQHSKTNYCRSCLILVGVVKYCTDSEVSHLTFLFISGQMEALSPCILPYFVISTQKILLVPAEHFIVGLILFDHARGVGCPGTVRRSSPAINQLLRPSLLHKPQQKARPPIRLLSRSFRSQPSAEQSDRASKAVGGSKSRRSIDRVE